MLNFVVKIYRAIFMQIFFLFIIKIFALYSLFLLFIRFGGSVLLNILDINIHEFSCRSRILCGMSSLSCRIHELKDWDSSRLSNISKIYVFINLLIKYSEFRQSVWKFVINKLNLNFIKYLLFKSINLGDLVSFKLFNKA